MSDSEKPEIEPEILPPPGAVKGKNGGWLMPFKKGADPRRARDHTDATLFRQAVRAARECSPDSIKRLIEIRDQRQNLAAATVAADRLWRIAWGDTKPPAPDLKGDDKARLPLDALSMEQLAALRGIYSTMAQAAETAAAAEKEMAEREGDLGDSAIDITGETSE